MGEEAHVIFLKWSTILLIGLFLVVLIYVITFLCIRSSDFNDSNWAYFSYPNGNVMMVARTDSSMIYIENGIKNNERIGSIAGVGWVGDNIKAGAFSRVYLLFGLLERIEVALYE